MIRTLQTYLGRDLLKATVLAGIVFTLVLTVFAVIEPLRERGLSSQQALRLFGYSMPVMVSLTLPIAALFAATVVYGRFGQDNELLACRASGIGTLSLLKPAVCLGVVVSVVTLVLGLYVAPRLLWASQSTIKANLKSIAYHRLRTQNHLRWEDLLVHVDRVDPDSGWVAGLIAMDVSNPRDAKVVVASKAQVDFIQREGLTFARLHLIQPAGLTQSGEVTGQTPQQLVQPRELPDLFKDEPKLYDWDRLCQTWSRPRENTRVREEVLKIRRQLCIQEFYRDVLESLQRQGRYDRLREYAPEGSEGWGHWIVLHGTQARLADGGDGVIVGTEGPQPESGPAPRAVAVTQMVGEQARRHLWARSLLVRAAWDNFRGAPVVTVTLSDVDIQVAGEAPDRTIRQPKCELQPFAVPGEVLASAGAVELDDLFDFPERYAQVPRIREMVDTLHKRVVTSLLAKVQAEMHQRLAYGISTLLMVMLGAALGLLFRGGQVLAAFAISAVPAAAVIILLLMGKQMIANPGVPAAYGILAIWGGVAGLAAATAYVYAVPMRR